MIHHSKFHSKTRHRMTKEQPTHSSEESTSLHGNKQCKNLVKNIGNLNLSSPIKSMGGRFAPKDEINGPLSGHPFFTLVMLKTQVESPYQLTVPTTFHSFLPPATVQIVLSYRNKDWKMNYIGDRSVKRFDGGWKNFAIDNNLKAGDGCVFELIDRKKLRFEVWILSGQVPDLFANCGRSSEIPIMID